MTVSVQTPIVSYATNGVTTAFAYPFAILSEDDLSMMLDAVPVTSGFTVSGVGDEGGGSVTFSSAPASGTLIIYRSVILEREVDYQENGDLPAETLDQDFDRIWMALQDQLLVASRCVRAPVGEALDEMPAAASRALRVLGFDASGQPIMLTRTDDGGAALALDLANPAPTFGSKLIAWMRRAVGAVARWVEDKLAESISPEDFGASANGVSDDSSAAQAAITHIATLGRGTLKFTPGKTYFLDSQINVCDNLTVIGYGAKIIAGPGFAGPGNPLFKNFSGTSFSAPGARLASQNVRFYGIEFDGQDVGVAGTTVPDADMHGAIICMGGWDANTGVDGFVVKDCNMHDFAGVGVMAWRSSNVDVSHNQFLNFFANTSLSSGAGIDLHDVAKATISCNRLNHTSTAKSWHAITILDWVTRSQELEVSGNIITNMNGGDGISCEGNGVDNLDDAVITGNVIKGCAGDGIGVDKCLDVTLTGNVIKTCGQLGITISDTQTIVIAGNKIEGAAGAGIFSNGNTTSATITGNQIKDITYLDATYQGDGIFIGSSGSFSAEYGSVVSDNIIIRTAANGIYAKTLGYNNVHHNQVTDAGRSASATRRNGITATSGAIDHNTITAGTATTAYGINPVGSDLPSLHANKFYGTFTGAKVFLSNRAGISQGASTLDFERIDYDALTNIMTTWGTATPTGSLRYVGDTHYNTTPVAAGTIGWVCTTSGIPGTWKTFGVIAA